MVFAALILAIPAAIGALAGVVGKIFPEKFTAILGGAVLGLTVFTTVAYILSTLLPLLPATWVTLLVMAGGVVGLLIWRRQAAWATWQALPLDRTAVIIFLVTLAFFSLIAPKLLISRPDGLYTGIINAYGDIAWHMANITAFTEGQSVPPENPIFAGTRLTYPFLTNFLSAMLLGSGASFPFSVNAVAVLMIPILLTLLYGLVREVTDNKRAAILALLLFVFGGGALGWTRFAGDWQGSNVSLVEFLVNLPARDYSGVGTDEQGFHFLNPTTTLLLPQRSFLFALPIACTILLLLLPRRERNPFRFLAAGAAAGLLPLFHAHTVLALILPIGGFFFLDLFQNEKPARRSVLEHWLYFLLPALVLGIPEVLYYLRGGSESGSFLRLAPRWMAGEQNFLWYWFLNTGLLIPVTIAGLFLMETKKEIKVLAISGLAIFSLANLFLFAPWAWDNFKLFVYFLVFLLPLVSLVCANLLAHPWLGVSGRIGLVVLISLHLLAAGLDMWKLALPTAREWQEWDKPGIEFAQAVQDKTRAGERVLTAANHNSPIVLAGRPRYLGFAAHVWSHGGDPWDREKAVKEFYEGRLDRLPDVQPAYVVVSPQERGSFPSLVIRPTWQLVTQVGDYALYQL